MFCARSIVAYVECRGSADKRQSIKKRDVSIRMNGCVALAGAAEAGARPDKKKQQDTAVNGGRDPPKSASVSYA